MEIILILKRVFINIVSFFSKSTGDTFCKQKYSNYINLLYHFFANQEGGVVTKCVTVRYLGAKGVQNNEKLRYITNV